MSRKAKKKKKAKKKQQKNQLKKKQAVLAVKPEAPREELKKEQPKQEPKKKSPALKEKIKKIPNKISGVIKTENKKWGIIIICGLALTAIAIQSWLDTGLNPQALNSNFSRTKTTAQEAYKISTYFDIISTDILNGGHYLAPGETDKDVFSFELQSNDNVILLKELILTTIGDLPENQISKLRLFEGESEVAKAERRGDIFVFKKFTSVLQPDTNKKYIIKADISPDTQPGNRFKFSILNPSDIGIYIDEEPFYALDTFPFDGAYTTVVGWRKK